MRRKREEGVVYQNQKKKEKCCITALDYQCDGFQAKRATTPTRGGCGNGASERDRPSFPDTPTFYCPSSVHISSFAVITLVWCWPPPSHNLLFIPPHLPIHLHLWLSLACPFLLFPYPLRPQMILLSSRSLLLILNLLLPPFRMTVIGRLFSALLLWYPPVFFGNLLLCAQPILCLPQKVLTVVSSRHFSHPREKEMPV